MTDLLELRIKKIIPETADAITLLLENTSGEPISYQSGQFLTFIITMAGRELRRSYSISSAPGIDPDIAVTIKRVENGEVSRYLLTHLKEGDILQSLPPAGRFTLATHPDNQRDIFLIGAGSGITPLFSLLKTTLVQEPKSKITLIDVNRNENTTLFREPINQLTGQYPWQFTLIHLFGDPLPHSHSYPQRLNIGLLQQLIQQHLTFDRTKAKFYVCGPSTFMRMVRMTLIFMEFAEDQIHREIFVTYPLPAAKTPLPSNLYPSRATIRYQQHEHSIFVYPGQTILKAALANGIQLPYSCQGGVCSTCAAKCTQGAVQMTTNEVLTDKDQAEGWILTCTAYPLSEEVTIQIGNV
jgi:ring-1,2-phenylacetyl-CoA epoxidase subunit PaaE